MNPQKTQTSEGLETVDETVARANQLVGNATSPSPVVTPTSLETNQAPVVTPTPIPVEQTKLMSDLAIQQEDAIAQEDALARKVEADSAAAQNGQQSSLDSFLKQQREAKGVSTLQSEAFATPGGVDAIAPELNEINDQIRKEQRSLELARRAITEKGGGLKSGARAEIANLERVSFQKQADLSIIQQAVQGRYDSAREIADRQVAAQFEQQTQNLAIAQFDYQEQKDLFTTAEQREYDLLFSDRQAKLDAAKTEQSDIKNLAIQAQQDGAPSEIVSQMLNSETLADASVLGGSFIGALDREEQRAGILATQASTRASNATATLREAELADITSAGNDPAAVTNTLANFDFLNSAAQQVIDLSGGASPNPTAEFLRKSIGSSSTEATQLLGFVDTLKANMLTLATDPSIKQFFGPQMSDADVRLMTAASSNLRPDEQTPEQLKTEAERIQDWINRAATAVREGSKGNNFGASTITAPDGTLIEIVD